MVNNKNKTAKVKTSNSQSRYYLLRSNVVIMNIKIYHSVLLQT